MDLGIRGKAFVLVGGSRGIGWETARILAEDGADVAIVCRNPEAIAGRADALAERCAVRIAPLAGDVVRPGSVEAAIDESIRIFGAIRGLAMTNFSKSHGRPFTEMDEAEWDLLYQDVLMGTVRSCKAVVPHLVAKGGGQIVVTSAYSARAPKPSLFAYAAFKAALINFTKNLAKTYGPQGIRANVVCPGFVDTARADERIAALMELEGIDHRQAERALLERAELKVALGRLGRPAELGEMMAFLLSERAAYTTGLVANVDGGTDF
jgi:NAD(P)-dependent dehydrogenase (short-subunit alcohol dehydrogenase family)